MRVHIRALRETDAPSMAAAARESTREAWRWLPWCHPEFSAHEAHAWILLKRDDWRRRREFNFAIVDGEDRFLGGCSLNQLHGSYPLANIGYWVRTSATRQGVAASAVRQTVAFASRETELIRLEILVAVGNDASVRVAEKVGAAFEGRLRSRLVLHGVPRDALLYALTLDRGEPGADA